MTSAGRICPLPKGDWNAETTYDFLDFVSYEGMTYIAKKVTTGQIPPTSTEDWQLFAGSIDSAMRYVGTITAAGISTAEKTDGAVYNVSEAFVTDATFLEGAGYGYAPGADIVWIGKEEKWNVLSGTRDQAAILLTLPLEGWLGETAPYTNTVMDPSIHDRTSFIVSTLSQSSSPEEYKPYKKAFAMILGATVGEGTATFAASDKPVIELTVNLIQGV